MRLNLDEARLFDIAVHQAKHNNLQVAVASKPGGVWVKRSSIELVDEAYRLAAGLLDKGIVPGDRVGIIASSNRYEWNVIDLAVLMIGAVDVPIYPTITEREYEFIITDSECKLLFVSDVDVHTKANNIIDRCASLSEIFIMDETEACSHWTTVMVSDAREAESRVTPYMDKVKHEDLATLIYTSGTTGVPKGVMLSHRNLISNVAASAKRLPTEDGFKSLSFLPLCHVFERMLIYLYAYKNVSIHYAQSLETVGDDLKEVKPDVFTAVPRLLEKVYGKILAKGEELSGVKRALFFWAVGLAERFNYYDQNGPIYAFKLKIARKLIFSKWQEALGGNVKLAACGSAALSPRLCRIFNGAGIPIMEGYGLTETSPVVSVSMIDNKGFRFGTTGRPIDKVEVKMAEDGEILVKGPNVMMGYYKRPDLTKQVIDEDGWFHTGDIGVLEDGEYLKITDRKKEIFKTSGGKYIAPQLMENAFKQSKYIEQIVVLGENQKHPAALIIPAFDILEQYCEDECITTSNRKEMLEDPKVKALFEEVVNTCNADFSKWEMVKKYELLTEEFSIDGGELTPTLKLRRKNIMSKYAAVIENIFS